MTMTEPTLASTMAAAAAATDAYPRFVVATRLCIRSRSTVTAVDPG